MTVLVTGGCGFIGSAIVRRLLDDGHEVLNLDKLTYAAVPEAIDTEAAGEQYCLIEGDISDQKLVECIFEEMTPDVVIHCAAETHVDRSIAGPGAFLTTNITGTYTLLEAARSWWAGRRGDFRFQHVSTDEVFGSLAPSDASFTEDSQVRPNSPYAASKAASDHLVRAWFQTYGLPVVTTHCSNNYGPWQNAEKLIPHMILNAADGKPLPIYGTGTNIRDWLHVDDHAAAILRVMESGRDGASYNVGGNCERTNLEVVTQICALMDSRLPSHGAHRRLIRHVADRAGHDHRYAVDTSLIETELGWKPERVFEDGLSETVDWYLRARREQERKQLAAAALSARRRPSRDAVIEEVEALSA